MRVIEKIIENKVQSVFKTLNVPSFQQNELLIKQIHAHQTLGIISAFKNRTV